MQEVIDSRIKLLEHQVDLYQQILHIQQSINHKNANEIYQ